MKHFLELPILCNVKGLCKPTIEDIGNKFLVNWSYQRTSWACQGQWAKWSRFINKSDDYYSSLRKIETELTEFIKQEYEL